jgi:hypothetical protein
MKLYIITLSDSFGPVQLIPVKAKTPCDAMKKGKDIALCGYEGLFVSNWREV